MKPDHGIFELSQYLTSYQNAYPKDKKPEKIRFWLCDYSRFHEKEDEYKKNKKGFKTYKRGNVIKAQLGFNVGHEFGGLHYCVVLDFIDNSNKGCLTVIPMTSNTKINREDVPVQDSIFMLILDKINSQDVQFRNHLSLFTEIQEKLTDILDKYKDCEISKESVTDLYNDLCQLKIEELANYKNNEKIIENFKELKEKNVSIKQANQTSTFKIHDIVPDVYDNNFADDFIVNLIIALRENLKQIELNLGNLKQMMRDIKKLKLNSKLLVGQIRTISKIRIYDPIHACSTLSGISVSEQTLMDIDNKIKDLFTKRVTKEKD